MGNKIVLVGYMASGKTKVGFELAKILGYNVFDLDFLIQEKLQMSISEIFRTKNELFFRKIEHQIFEEMMESNDSFILSTGGGTPCYANNHLYLKREFVHSFYLKSSVETLVKRLENQIDKRPIINENSGSNLNEFVAKHLFDRSFYYLQAQFIVSTDEKSIAEIAKEISKIYLNQTK